MSGCERHFCLFIHRCVYPNEEHYKQFVIRANDTCIIQCQGSDIIDFIKCKSARLG